MTKRTLFSHFYWGTQNTFNMSFLAVLPELINLTFELGGFDYLVFVLPSITHYLL